MKKVFAILSIAGMLLTTTGLSAQEKKEDKKSRFEDFYHPHSKLIPPTNNGLVTFQEFVL